MNPALSPADVEIQLATPTLPPHTQQQVASLFEDMHLYMSTCGLSHPLAPEGAQLWLAGIRPALGRLHFLVLAQQADQVVGFAHGNIRFLPNYLGGHKGGFIGFVYLAPALRSLHLGQALVARLEEQLTAHGARFIELEVLQGNPSAQAFWQKQGYQTDLLRMIKLSTQ